MMRAATPQDPQSRVPGWARAVPWIARLAAGAAVCNAIGLVVVVLPCGAQERDEGGPVILAAACEAGADCAGRPISPTPAGKSSGTRENRLPIRPQSADVAAPPPPGSPGADPRAALDRAALRALEQAMAHRGARREYAGVIYRTAAGYAHTPPRRADREGGFELRLRPGVDLPRGAEVVALYHTHPRAAGRRADAHSPHDVEVARELGLVSYLGVVASGAVRAYDPAARPRAPADYPRGAHVGALVEGVGGPS